MVPFYRFLTILILFIITTPITNAQSLESGLVIDRTGHGIKAVPLEINLLKSLTLPPENYSGSYGITLRINTDEPDNIYGIQTLISSSEPDVEAVGGDFIISFDGGEIRTGVNGQISGIGGDKYGLRGSASQGGDSNTGVFGVASAGDINYGLLGTASLGGINYGMRGIAFRGIENYGVYGEASGGDINYAGYFVGDVKTNGNSMTTSLTVGDTSNTEFKAMQGGTFQVGADYDGNNGSATIDTNPAIGFAQVAVTFPNEFPTPPILIVTPSAQNGSDWDDSFAITTKRITTTGAILNIYRLDDQTQIWGQNLEVDWIGFSK